MRALDKRLLRTVDRSRLQFLAIIVVIALGLMALVVLNNAYQNLDGAMSDYYERQSFAHLFSEFVPQPPDYVEGLRDLPEIREAEGRIVTDIRADIGRDIHPELHMVALPEEGDINRPLVLQGHLPGQKDRNEVALLAGFAEENDLQVGDEIDLIVREEAIKVRVSAVVSSPEFLYPITDISRVFAPDNEYYGIAFADLDFAADILGMPGQVNQATFMVAEGHSFESAEEAVRDAMGGRGLMRVITRDDQLSHYSVSLRTGQLEDLASSIPLIFLAISAVIIYMLLMRMVEADRTVIGVLKAIGYSDGEVLMHYLKYALGMGFVGALLGMVIGHLLVRPVTETFFLEFFDMPLLQVQTDWSLIILGSLLTLVFCVGTGMWATRTVLQITPADAMQPAAPPPGQKNLLERWFPRLWSWLAFTTKLMLRQLLRNKKRFALAVLGVAFAYTLVVLPFYMLGILDAIVFEQFDEFEVYDYAVSFNEPISEAGIAQIREEADMKQIEPLIEYPFEARNGWRNETVPVRALPEGGTLQRFQNARGQRISIPTSGVLVCEYMAGALNVGPGDDVLLSSHITDEHEHHIPVKDVIRQDLGSGMYVSHQTMQAMTGDGDAYTGAFVQSADDIRYRLRHAFNVKSITSVDQMVEGIDEMMGLVIALCTILVLMGGVFAFAILFNIATVGIMERTREFSSMRVLGYDRKSIYHIILHENILATIFGLILGAPMGHVTFVAVVEAFQRTEMIYLPVPFHPGSHVAATMLVCGFVALVMMAVRVKIRNLDLLEALSSRMT